MKITTSIKESILMVLNDKPLTVKSIAEKIGKNDNITRVCLHDLVQEDKVYVPCKDGQANMYMRVDQDFTIFEDIDNLNKMKLDLDKDIIQKKIELKQACDQWVDVKSHLENPLLDYQDKIDKAQESLDSLNQEIGNNKTLKENLDDQIRQKKYELDQTNIKIQEAEDDLDHPIKITCPKCNKTFRAKHSDNPSKEIEIKKEPKRGGLFMHVLQPAAKPAVKPAAKPAAHY